MLDARPIRARTPSWVTAAEVRLAVVVAMLLLGVMAIATSVAVPPWLHTVGLYLHLAALVVGLGAVLSVDWMGLLFLVRRASMADVLVQAERMGPLIWTGLAGLAVSCCLLEPRLDSSLTVVKLVAVLGVSTVGVLAAATKRRMSAELPLPSRSLLLRGSILAAASQSLWWTAVTIGFLNAQR